MGIALNGTSQAVLAPAVNFTSDCAWWLKFRSSDATAGFLLGSWDTSETDGLTVYYYGSLNDFSFELWNGSVTLKRRITHRNATLRDNNWRTIGFRRSGTVTEVVVDGTLVSGSAPTYVLEENNLVTGDITKGVGVGIGNLYNGGSWAGGDNYWQMDVGEYRFYQRDVSVSEFATLHSGTNISAAGLAVWYNFASGALDVDSSGNGRTATLLNSPTWVDSPANPGVAALIRRARQQSRTAAHRAARW